MLKVGIEGPCCAGKTTLGRNLTHKLSQLSVGYVKDYSDYVGGGKFLPPAVPSSIAEEKRSLEIFLAIEANRTKDIRSKAIDLQIALIDRSIYTLLAHCRGLEDVIGLGYFDLAQKTIQQSSIPMWPDVILYLDVTHNIIRARNKGKFEESSIYLNPSFNDGIRSYFLELAGLRNPCVIWLEALHDPTTLCTIAKTSIVKWLSLPEGKEKII